MPRISNGVKPLIVANWKMNPQSLQEARMLFEAIDRKATQNKAEIVICPPFLYISALKGVILGAQDVFWEQKGAYTGEISPLQLKDLGVEYVLVGHSERRKYFGESDEDIAKKMKAILAAGMTPILCVDHEEQIPKEVFGSIIIAYEPLSAIGTGKNYEPQDVKEKADSIRALAPNARVMYGGSVNSENATSYLKDGGVDGLLIGGASLDATEFNRIIQSCQTI